MPEHDQANRDTGSASLAPIRTSAMPASSNGTPQQARVFDLLLDNNGPNIDLFYSNSGVLEIDPDADWDDQLLHFLYDRANGSTSKPMRGSVVFPNRNANPRIPQVELSLRAPVEETSGNYTIADQVDRCFYVIRLLVKKGRNADENPCEIRFSTSFDPFSVSLADIPDNQDSKVFSMPHFVRPGGLEAPDGNEHDPDKYGVATVAGFLFDFGKARTIFESEQQQQQQQQEQQQQQQQQQQEWIPEFVLRFNLNLEIATRPRGYGSSRLREFLPIIIDPDIGHPGGNAAGP